MTAALVPAIPIPFRTAIVDAVDSALTSVRADEGPLGIYMPAPSRLDASVVSPTARPPIRWCWHDESAAASTFPGVEAQRPEELLASIRTFTHIKKDVPTQVTDRGVTGGLIQQMLVEAPRRYFG